MLFFHRSLAVHSYLVAVVAAVAVPMSLGYIIFKTNPSACYDSPCLLPLLLMIVPPYAAPVLAALFAINRRRKKLVPDGWLPTIVFSGFAGQIAISVFAVSMSRPGLRDIFFSDLLSVPQGLIVGLTIGAVFWVALNAFAQKSTLM
jgi:hypothetical protein